MKKTFGCAAKYHTHLRHIKDMCCLLNPNTLLNIWDHNTGSPIVTANNDQVTCNTSDSAIKL